MEAIAMEWNLGKKINKNDLFLTFRKNNNNKEQPCKEEFVAGIDWMEVAKIKIII